MKKFAIICILFVTSFFSTAHAKSISRSGKWNFGIQCHALHPIKLYNKYKNLDYLNYNNIIQGIIALRPGIFSKYQFNPHFNIELKSNILENVIKDIKHNTFSTYFSNIEYAANIIHPIKDKINVYTKIGAQLTAEINNNKLTDIFMLQKYKQFYPIFSVGMEYLINQYVHCDVHVNINKKLNQVNFKSLNSLLNNINVGISWKLYPHIKIKNSNI
ncbi:Outer membrane protein A [Buchnera aphidicola (Cinara kochiana kochiana)]|uniref:Outer membrane protein A, partial n=1 Tax=Buchnera aphidicola (Cinara kochiana kochiana) TaxID=2518976 RepID=A0A451D5L0_9GAMM|nr:outer membrane beta-barrel protein [Buchnera aphidicola]VFP81131.1 Outer membrane protein A [Buchnera aphidicola (Cinara kochiana kochiana)]